MTRPHIQPDYADPFLTTSEAARLLGVSLRSVQLWDEAGTLPAGRTPGGHRRIRTSDVNALAQKMGIKMTEPAENPLQDQFDDARRQIAERDELIATLRARLFVPDVGADQDWSTVDGAVAWHLIYRHGDLSPQQQPLGAPTRPAPAPTPTVPKVISPGIVQSADGRLSTDIAPPAAAAPACSSCIDVKRSMASYPCSTCTYPDRPHWWPAARGARP